MRMRHTSAVIAAIGVFIGLAPTALAGHGLEADIDELEARLNAGPEGPVLTVRFEVEIEFDDRRPPLDPAIIFSVRERGAIVVDRSGEPLEYIVPLEQPHEADHDEFEFRGEVDLPIPEEALYDPRSLEVLAEVVSDGNRSPLAAREEDIDGFGAVRLHDPAVVAPAEPIITPVYTETVVADYPNVVVAPPPVLVAPRPVIVNDCGPSFSIGAAFSRTGYSHRSGYSRHVSGHRTVVRRSSSSYVRPPVSHGIRTPSVRRSSAVHSSPRSLGSIRSHSGHSRPGISVFGTPNSVHRRPSATSGSRGVTIGGTRGISSRGRPSVTTGRGGRTSVINGSRGRLTPRSGVRSSGSRGKVVRKR